MKGEENVLRYENYTKENELKLDRTMKCHTKDDTVDVMRERQENDNDLLVPKTHI